jgi:p-aminobenzoyl-glutamate transporter AbgT
MEQRNDSMRERLLVALPRPENLAAYREETAALLAKHAKALRWDKITQYMLLFLFIASVLLWNHGPYRPGTDMLHGLQGFSAVLFFLETIYAVRYEIYVSQIATLKEVKQVQLQILELQASLKTTRENQP